MLTYAGADDQYGTGGGMYYVVVKNEQGTRGQYRIEVDAARADWSLENLAAGTPVGVIEVDAETARWALEALKRMLQVK